MYDQPIKLVHDASRIAIIQPENPDGDSLGSALALEEILGELGKTVSLYCSVNIPRYLRYIQGWDRVSIDLDTKADLAIIVDTVSDTLLSKTLASPPERNFLQTCPVLVIDHHSEVTSSLPFEHHLLVEKAVSTSEVIFELALAADWKITAVAAENMLVALLADSLGLTTEGVTAHSFAMAARLMELGASPAALEQRRRTLMKKAPEILAYKGELIGRIEYLLNGRLAMIHIPWEDIRTYSDQYNPSVLILDEMRLVSGVELAIAIKTYPDGKVTGKLRSNLPIAEQVAASFGGGGHKYSAGFRVYDSYETVLSELVSATDTCLKEYAHDSEAI